MIGQPGCRNDCAISPYGECACRSSGQGHGQADQRTGRGRTAQRMLTRKRRQSSAWPCSPDAKKGIDCNAIQRPTSSDMDNTDRAETVHPWLTKQKSHEIFRFTAPAVDIPTRWNPRAKQQQRVALADFSAAPWQGFEKSERGPNNSSLFQPQAAVVVVALG